MNRKVLYAVFLGSVIFTGCNQHSPDSPKTARSISIAGAPVYEKDFTLKQVLLVDNAVAQPE